MDTDLDFIVHYDKVVVQPASLEVMLNELFENVKAKLTRCKMSEYEKNQIGWIACQEFRHGRKRVYMRTLAGEYLNIKIQLQQHEYVIH